MKEKVENQSCVEKFRVVLFIDQVIIFKLISFLKKCFDDYLFYFYFSLFDELNVYLTLIRLLIHPCGTKYLTFLPKMLLLYDYYNHNDNCNYIIIIIKR